MGREYRGKVEKGREHRAGWGEEGQRSHIGDGSEQAGRVVRH